MTVLVAYGTTNGSTGEIARWIGDELRGCGLDVEVWPAAQVYDVNRYEAVILGGAMYMFGWHRDARQFAHRFAGALARRPVWLFSSGPLDDSADQLPLPPIPQADAVMRVVHARGHVTFGGRLSEDARGWLGFVAHRMADEGRGGDFRNPLRVRAWAHKVAEEIKESVPVPVGSRPGRR